jgi:hypothetical protein
VLHCTAQRQYVVDVHLADCWRVRVDQRREHRGGAVLLYGSAEGVVPRGAIAAVTRHEGLCLHLKLRTK